MINQMYGRQHIWKGPEGTFYMNRETWLVVGLGNPGIGYEHTRHNAGFDTLDLLAKSWQTPIQKKRMEGLLAEIAFQGKRVVLCKPQTYMNLSGSCVMDVAAWYKVPMDHLLVVYDDIDLPLGQLRMRKSGSAGTHNGMRSIIGMLGTDAFPRLRIGVGGPPPGWELARWVLSRFATEEQPLMNEAFQLAAQGIEAWLSGGLDAAMRHCNVKR